MVPTWLQALVLGLVQGLTEFFPVSSSGHLVIVPALLGWPPPDLAFDVALHMGTAGAVVVYFRADLVAMARALVTRGDSPPGRFYRRLAVALVVSSVPVALIGLGLKSTFERAFATPAVASGFLFLTAALLVAGERVRSARVGSAARIGASGSGPAHPSPTEQGPRGVATGADVSDPVGRRLDELTLPRALVIGVAQTLALFPGVSRSGTTITAGVVAGLTREAATRFSFLLALPALAGAGVLSLPDLARPGMFGGLDLALGVLAAFATGYAAIHFLLRLVARERLTGFAVYCAAVGVLGLVGSLPG
ncbi:MAG: undecaprenyl-diphosphate phosphatase [Actinomycetota bacterium]|nr:undecaprenyl-diphosphate phosphatase [Actinomycetota bacterium]